MRTLIACLLAAAATPSVAQTVSFEAGKQLPIPAGSWTYVQTATGSQASYAGLFVVRCDRAARTVQLVRPGVAGPLTIVTSESSRALAAGNTLTARDPLLDAIAYSRGRVLVSGAATPAIAVPAWPEAARAIEDCRI